MASSKIGIIQLYMVERDTDYQEKEEEVAYMLKHRRDTLPFWNIKPHLHVSPRLVVSEFIVWSLSLVDCRTETEILSPDADAYFIHDVCYSK